MKFGKSLSRNQLPEWASSYINYKGLKKLVNAASETAKRGETADLAEFFFVLDRNLEDVDSFYNKKFADINRRLRLLQDRYGGSPEVVAHLDRDEIEELMDALLEQRSQLRNLQWFGEINRRGFVKITKKLDRKVPNTTTQHRYIATRVDPCPFARDTGTARAMSEVNRWLLALGDSDKKMDDAKSERSTHSLGRASTKAKLSLSDAVLEKLDQAVRSGNAKALDTALREGNVPLNEDSYSSSQGLLLNLLQRSISARGRDNITFLLKHLRSLDDADDINQRNCIHRLVIHIGRSKSASVALPKSDGTAVVQSFSHMNYATQYLTPAASPLPAPRASNTNESRPLMASDPRVQLLTFLLDSLSPSQRPAISARDSYGRMPLHYAAQFGFVVVCEAVISRMQAWDKFDASNGIDAPEWQDKEGFAPLHLSVIGGHPLTTKTLLQSENWQEASDSKGKSRRETAKSSEVLAIATKHDHYNIVQMLVDAGVDINWQDEAGETALHIAARFGHNECAKVILTGSENQKADLDLTEKTFAWTPLHISAVDGHLSVAQLLVEAGAEVDKVDSSGWTAQEHAALRGHLDIARLLRNHSQISPGQADASPALAAVDGPSGSGDEVSQIAGTTPPLDYSYLSLDDRRSKGSKRPGLPHEPQPQPVRAYGHRYLTDETLVLVSLGSMDMRKNIEAVTLDQVPLAEVHNTQLDTALSIVVSAKGAVGEPTIVDLPVQENISTEPIVFRTKDLSKVKILFDIVPTYSGNQKNKLGRGVSLLSSAHQNFGSKRMSLQGDTSAPIIGADYEVIGTVNFNFLVITPFTHPNMGVTSKQTYWRKVSSEPMVIGHRGLGKNVAANRSLQLGENTIPSFIAAANLGANYVEFDVQLTKDHIPVIYHDFLVSETGLDAPVHTLTLEQFLHINDGGRGRHITNGGNGFTKGASKLLGPDAASLINGADFTTAVAKSLNTAQFDNRTNTDIIANGKTNGSHSKEHVVRRPRRAMSMSVGQKSLDERERIELDERMKHTKDFKEKGFKANSRGNFIQAPFATLEDLFQQLPASVGFNIEMKYPMLHESEEHEMDTYAVELNSFCDTVLAKVYDFADGRDIIFSSFNPDICLCLSFKQPNYPIMFLTDAGGEAVGDIRASSLQEAIRFARRWNLLGIVSLSDPLVISPRLVRVVKQNGLVCVSYGSENNNPELVERQVKEGIDAVIVDNVLAIRKGLTKEVGKSTAASDKAATTTVVTTTDTTSTSTRSEEKMAAAPEATTVEVEQTPA